MPFMEIDAFTLITTIFWIWMLIDCLLNKRVKLFWFIFILFTHVFGAVFYFFVACSHRNPADALAYYIRRFNGATKQNPAKPTFKQKPQAVPKAPIPLYTPYQQGYTAQPPTPLYSEAPMYPQYQEAPSAYNPQSEYEQPTTTYPEMPPQQMH